MTDNPFGDFIRQRRRDLGLTHAELARRANFSVSLIEKIEAGTRPPTFDTIQVLFDRLDVPQMFRKHILGLSVPGIYGAGAPGQPSAADLTDLDSLHHPASFYVVPTFTVVAANAAFRHTFPGGGPGTSFVEWMFLNPDARTVVVDWQPEAQRLIQCLRMFAPAPAANRELRELIGRCQQSADWDGLWNNAFPITAPDTGRIQLRGIGNGRTRSMGIRLYSPEYPARPWWMCRLLASPA
ncbi:helix-turn-helix domain-containing protein [Nocardia sp. NPDC020380]|uniref:helix-turn-helix domain-containing protein n=1 Tax=Nocardia sp. NPDC020380 TaxID=3364309 RepID=UPI00379980B0